ncbi:MAG: SUMF1/EgtB/PvdO family nonheme iron enzyme, partial [Elusimicrobia bacterium]|nr:SUMF1/EgtB/PvdO family nonheme iron enzyme [Elusimicrobiota bacterium]
SMTDTGVLYADASGIRGIPGGNVVDTLAATLGAGNDAGGAAVKNLGDVSVGAGTAVSTLSASGFLGLANLSGQPSGAGAGALYYNPAAFSGQGALYLNLNGAFVPVATGTVAGGGGMTGVISNANQFSGDGAGVGTSLTLKSSSVTLQGNSFNGAGQLVRLDGAGKLPAVDGSQLTSLPVDTIAAALGAGSNAGGTGITNLGNVAIGAVSAGTSLDVKGGGGYVQFWRDSGGVIVASMTDTGVLYADASGIRGLSGGGNVIDTLDATLTAGGDAGGKTMVNLGDVAIGAASAATRLDVQGGGDGNVQFWRNAAGVVVASMTDTGVMFMDGSGVRNLGSGNVVDTLVATLGAGNSAGGTGITNLGNVAVGGAVAGTRLDVRGSGDGYTQFWRNSGGVVVASMTDTGVLYADASGIRGLPSGGGNVVDTLAATLGAGNDAGGAAMKNLGDVSVGAGTAVSTLSASGFLGLANLSSQPSGAGAGAMYYNPSAFSGQGALYVNFNGAFLPIATGTVAGGGGLTGVVSDSNQFSGDGAGPGTSLTLKSSSVTLQGNAFNGSGQLVKLDGAGRLPAVDGSMLTSLPAGAGAESCTNPNDPSDILVQVGDFCVDKYEASVWSGPTGGTQYGIASDNYPCGDDGQNCLPGSNPVYARSVSGVTPSSYVTWFQASAACTNAGKHLITNAEWQAAVTGTPKTGSGIAPGCNFADTGPTATGAGTNCRSYYDVENMVGSLWEMVSDWGMYTANAQYDAWAAGDDGAGGPSASPVAVTLRGGAFNVPSPYTGPKTFYMGAAPNSAGDGTIGFRCAMRLR